MTNNAHLRPSRASKKLVVLSIIILCRLEDKKVIWRSLCVSVEKNGQPQEILCWCLATQGNFEESENEISTTLQTRIHVHRHTSLQPPHCRSAQIMQLSNEDYAFSMTEDHTFFTDEQKRTKLSWIRKLMQKEGHASSKKRMIYTSEENRLRSF